MKRWYNDVIRMHEYRKLDIKKRGLESKIYNRRGFSGRISKFISSKIMGNSF